MTAEALTTIRAVGSALPADVLSAVVGNEGLKGLTSDDYHLELGVTPREAANRAWSVLSSAYRGFRDALREGDPAVGLTREKWLGIVLRELGFGRVPQTPAGGLHADDRSFAISHTYVTDAGEVPIHLLGWGVDLDKRTPGQPGAADRAPHAMVQEYLNRSDGALWGLVSNGRRLRLLRDSSTLIGQSFVEFDLEAMFDGEVFSDFVVFFLVCHASRFDTRNLDSQTEPTPADCWLERWRSHAAETGTRALTGLRPAVAKAIAALGTGFVRHPANDLHHRLQSRELSPDDLHHALLRLVYRLLFCFVAEDRGLLLDPNADPLARQRYTEWFSTARLRRIATRRHGTKHTDQWQILRLVLNGLGAEGGRPELGVPGLGGIFELGESDVLAAAELSNSALFEALRHLTVVQPAGGGPKRRVDYRNLGAEELGSVYESLLEFAPRYDEVQKQFSLETVVGNERKTSGAYYTPSSLIDCLLDSALEPLLDDAEKADDPEHALLTLTVCDPACGSGHFLVAAAKRIAARVATVRARADGADEPTPIDAQRAMHDVVDRCIYGVDLNPLAAELAKVSLWLESVQPGRALSFLDAHIKVGNALLGTTPALLAAGIPDEAFTALDGDDKTWVTTLKKRNKQERGGQGELFNAAQLSISNTSLATGAAAIDSLPGMSLADVQLAARRHREFEQSPVLRRARLVADGWCAAFVTVKTPTEPAITQSTLRRFEAEPLPMVWGISTWGGPDVIASSETTVVARLGNEYKFFHWQLEFPQIFRVPAAESTCSPEGPGWEGGFSCVVGNPPWERIKLQEQEFFAAADPEIAGAPNAAARKRLIASLPERNPGLHAAYVAAKRRADGDSQLLRLSGRYPLCGRGDINTYAVFAEHDRSVVGPTGRMGVIVPTGIATDATTQFFFKDLVERGALVSLYDFENARPLFEGVHRSFKFCLLTLAGSDVRVPSAEFAFFQTHPDDLAREDSRFELAPDELRLLNPNTGTCPVFRTRRDAEITLGIYRRHPVLINENLPEEEGNPWNLSFVTMFHMSNDSHLFHTREQLECEDWTLDSNVFVRGDAAMLPLYEGKMGHQFDDRYATFTGTGDTDIQPMHLRIASALPLPRYWVHPATFDERLGRRQWGTTAGFVGHRRVARNNDERTSIATILPRQPASYGWIISAGPDAKDLLALCAIYNSVPFDYALRNSFSQPSIPQSTSEQVPAPPPARLRAVPPWTNEPGETWIRRRAVELAYTSNDLARLAAEAGYPGEPFVWNISRRAQLRAELDAGLFHVYGLDRSDTEHVLSTFPIANRNDPDLTPRILGEYDAMQQAMNTGIPYRSRLDPPPGQGRRHESRPS